MKNLKKLLAMALALMLVFSLAVTAMAADETYTLTINNKAEGHTYEAYQIFKGKLSNAANPDDEDGTSAELSDIQWGDSVTYIGDGVVVGKDADGNDIYSKEAEYVAVALQDGALLLADLIADLQLGTPKAESTYVAEKGQERYKIAGLPAGYYLVKDKSGSLNGEFDAYTDYIVEVVENSVVNPKSSVPSVDKYVKDTNDSNGMNSDWQISADHDIGDNVPFKIVATLARNVSSFKGPYKLVFHDTMEAGLTYNEDIKIYVGDAKVYEENVLDNEHISVSYEGTALTITIDDAKEIGAGNGAVISMEYTAKLNENAIHYTVGNSNSVKLEFANDPTWVLPDDPDNPDDPDDPKDPPTGETPESVVIVYTYKLQVDKVHKNPAYDPSKDENNDGVDDMEFVALEGAGFTLYKKNAEGHYVAVGDEITGVTEFVWAGLDDGDYKLSETTTPAGYNTADDIRFTITAVHDKDKADHVLTLTGDGSMEIVGDALTTFIENKPGAVLPETGGMGTTVFYLIGGVMVAAAVVLLVTKKRMSSAE
ncbi:MAG: isopeptide-forming domain-containing fimbrial protein [Oscillospiraceae bacterium]|nr:isopeptide-forming domain-containing fimbrial protein [Oscillospiraceae bacterium]